MCVLVNIRGLVEFTSGHAKTLDTPGNLLGVLWPQKSKPGKLYFSEPWLHFRGGGK